MKQNQFNLLLLFTQNWKFHEMVYFHCSFSKQKYLVDASTVSDLPDGTPCYKTYTNSKNQRFWTPEQSSKNHILYLFILTLLDVEIYRGRWSVVLQSVNNKNGNVEGYVDQKVDFSFKKFPRAGCVCFLNGARPWLQHNNRYYYANVMGQSRWTIFWDALPTQRYSFFRNLPSLFTSL